LCAAEGGADPTETAPAITISPISAAIDAAAFMDPTFMGSSPLL
jgi:hypothetical protein